MFNLQATKWIQRHFVHINDIIKWKKSMTLSAPNPMYFQWKIEVVRFKELIIDLFEIIYELKLEPHKVSLEHYIS